jgi:hypothetical protein
MVLRVQGKGKAGRRTAQPPDQKKSGPVKTSSPGRSFQTSRIYLSGLFGVSPAFGSTCGAALAAIGLPVSLPKRVK